jgi:hypothetical protein
VYGILGVDPALDRMPAAHDVALAEGKLLPRRHLDLLLHEVDARRELRDGMLDLDPRVHLDEEELVVLEQELERARAAIADLAACVGAALTDPRERPHGEARRGRLLDDLLVAALHRAVALEQVDGVLVLVREHLDLDVPRIAEELLHVDLRIAEGRLRLERVSVAAETSAASVCTTRIPRPPPPPAALMITG